MGVHGPGQLQLAKGQKVKGTETCGLLVMGTSLMTGLKLNIYLLACIRVGTCKSQLHVQRVSIVSSVLIQTRTWKQSGHWGV